MCKMFNKIQYPFEYVKIKNIIKCKKKWLNYLIEMIFNPLSSNRDLLPTSFLLQINQFAPKIFHEIFYFHNARNDITFNQNIFNAFATRITSTLDFKL